MILDDYDLPLSTVSETAAEHYREGVRLMLCAWPGAGDELDTAIEADPGFALALAARARHHAIHAQPAQARERIAAAVQAVERAGTERERSHVEIVALAIGGRSSEALERALAHAERWPRDVIILGMPLGAFGLFAFSGMADHDQARVALCERHAAHFTDDDWWFLTNFGWALAENGEVARGRAMLERAHELRRRNANNLHALVHSMFEAGAHDEAEATIGTWLPDYGRAGILHGHIAWHAALAALERGDPDAALATYAQFVAPSVSQGAPINVVTDAASFLWRLDAYGHGAPAGLWREAADYARAAFPKPGHAFVDAHMAMIEAATDREADVGSRAAALDALVETGALGAGPVAPAICRAALAFRREDWDACVTTLSPLAADVARIGGSGAQRQVIEDTLLLALMRGGRTSEARALLDRRLRRRPSARDLLWRGRLAA